MPISYATLQIYDQYLTTYGSKRCSRYDTHDSKELKELYSSIQLKNRFAPVYLKSPTATEISYAIQLKEQAKSLHETIDTLSCDDENQLFSTKTAYSDHPGQVSVSYEPTENQGVSSYCKAPAHFVMSKLATTSSTGGLILALIRADCIHALKAGITSIVTGPL